MEYEDYTWRKIILHTEQKLADYFGEQASEPYRFVLMELYRELLLLEKQGDFVVPVEAMKHFFALRQQCRNQFESTQPKKTLQTARQIIEGMEAEGRLYGPRRNEWKHREQFEATHSEVPHA